jgi:hypothetical protein
MKEMVGHVAGMGEMTDEYEMLVGKLDETTWKGSSRRWEDNTETDP